MFWLCNFFDSKILVQKALYLEEKVPEAIYKIICNLRNINDDTSCGRTFESPGLEVGV